MTPVGFEPTISAGKRQYNYALDRAVTDTGYECNTCSKVRNQGIHTYTITEKQVSFNFVRKI